MYKDAATFKQTAGSTSYIVGSSARDASDKIFQFNSRRTVSIKNFYTKNYGKVVRSYDNYTANKGPHNIILNNVIAKDGGILCGINSNFSDTCRIFNSCQDSGKNYNRYKDIIKSKGSSSKIDNSPNNVSYFISNFSETY
ncbi:pectate lyase [Diaporthe sp. PMI_573]|nr:pectate lyase [Diaporthaceae sp. PMI_573]